MRQYVVIFLCLLSSVLVPAIDSADKWIWKDQLTIDEWSIGINKEDSSPCFFLSSSKASCAPVVANYILMARDESLAKSVDISSVSNRLATSLECGPIKLSTEMIQALYLHVKSLDKEREFLRLKKIVISLTTKYKCKADGLEKKVPQGSYIISLPLKTNGSYLVFLSTTTEDYDLLLLKNTQSSVELLEWSKASKCWVPFTERYIRSLCDPSFAQQTISTDITKIATCAITYKMAYGKYPEGDDWARVLEAHCKLTIPVDPWGKQYSLWVPPNSGLAIVGCLGSKSSFIMVPFEGTMIPLSLENAKYTVVVKDNQLFWLSPEKALIPINAEGK